MLVQACCSHLRLWGNHKLFLVPTIFSAASDPPKVMIGDIWALSTPCHGATWIFPASKAVLHPDWMRAMVPLARAMVPLAPQRGVLPTCASWPVVGRVSKKKIQKGSNQHSSLHLMGLLGRSHLVQEPWVPSFTDLALLPTSCIKVLFAKSGLREVWKCPGFLPMQGLPMIVSDPKRTFWLVDCSAGSRLSPRSCS